MKDLTKEEVDCSFTWFGKTFTEAQYLRAKKHHRYRWILASILSIPVSIVGLIIGFATPLSFAALGFGLAGCYWLGTEVFPGAKDYKSTLYKKYENHRCIEAYREREELSRWRKPERKGAAREGRKLNQW